MRIPTPEGETNRARCPECEQWFDVSILVEDHGRGWWWADTDGGCPGCGAIICLENECEFKLSDPYPDVEDFGEWGFKYLSDPANHGPDGVLLTDDKIPKRFETKRRPLLVQEREPRRVPVTSRGMSLGLSDDFKAGLDSAPKLTWSEMVDMAPTGPLSVFSNENLIESNLEPCNGCEFARRWNTECDKHGKVDK